MAGALGLLASSAYGSESDRPSKCGDTRGTPEMTIQDCSAELDNRKGQEHDQFAAYLNRARAYIAKRLWDSAIQDYNAAVRLFPDSATIYVERGTAYDRKGELVLALADFSTAIRLDANNARAFSNRGLAQYKSGAYDLALADFDEAIRLDPALSVSHNGRGISYAMKGEQTKAIAAFSDAIRLNAFYAIAYSNRGRAYASIGDFGSAIADLKKAVQIEEDPKFYNELAWTYFRSGDSVLGLPVAAKALRMDPSYADAYDTRAAIYESLGDREKAISDLKMALKLNPKLAISAASLQRLTTNNAASENFPQMVLFVQKQGWEVNLGELCDKFDIPKITERCLFRQVSVEEAEGRTDPRGLNVQTSNIDPGMEPNIVVFHLKPLAGEFFVVSSSGVLLKSFVRFKGSGYQQVANEEVTQEFKEDMAYWQTNSGRIKEGLIAQRPMK